VLFVWVVVGFLNQPASAGDKATKKRIELHRGVMRLWHAMKEAPSRDWNTTVTGRADTQELAESVALVRAQHELEDYLRTQNPRIEHIPSTEYIRSHLVDKHEIQPATDSGTEGEGKFVATLKVGLTNERFEDLLQEQAREKQALREALARERMVGVGKSLGVLVAFLAAITGYLRLEEATKGYYTTWLRIAAVSFVSAVGVGIWLAC
jgi:hypothetical protein